MVFSSLVFLCVFFPLQMLLYTFARGIEAKNTVLILFSLVFYAWGEPFYIVLLLFMAFADWAISQLIYRYRGTGKSKAFLVLGCVIDLGLLAFFKYTMFLLTETHDWFGFPSVVPQIALPIGISFYTFQLLSYMVDVYRQEVPAQPKFRRLLLYVSLFHQCIAGPIVRYQDVAEQILCRHVDSEDMRNGINRFVSGLAKKVLLANVCGQIASRTILSGALADRASNMATLESASALALWLGCFAYALQIYLDFSAYSDMAIGMGLMVGFRYKENFNYPYLANSITDFWRRWHMSLSSFFRDYVYIPLGGQPEGQGPPGPEPADCVVFNRHVARRRMELHPLGAVLLRVPGIGEVPHPWAAAPAHLLCPPVHPGGGVLWLGAVLLYRLYPGMGGPEGPVLPQRQPPGEL